MTKIQSEKKTKNNGQKTLKFNVKITDKSKCCNIERFSARMVIIYIIVIFMHINKSIYVAHRGTTMDFYFWSNLISHRLRNLPELVTSCSPSPQHSSK